LIRRRHSPAGGDAFFRLEINRTAMQKKLLLVTTNPQLDALFAAEAISVGSSGG
jgi:type III restriction enzyme